jgi:hypothetical protein
MRMFVGLSSTTRMRGGVLKTTPPGRRSPAG